MTAKINKLLTSVEYEDTAALTLVDGAATGIIASTAQVMSSSSTDVKQDSATNTGSADKQVNGYDIEVFYAVITSYG